MAPPRSLSTLLLLATAAACSAGGDPATDARPGRVEQAGTGTLAWKGYDWNVTTGGMAGVAQGDPSNVSVDASGYLHLKITKNGATWTAAELVSATNLGFGTYQWQIAGPIDRMDHTVVLGLAPYGPAAGIGADGFNEIDTEFSYWNDELGNVNMDWGVYPATAAGTHQEKDFFFSLSGGTEATARMVWSKTSVVSTILSGFVPLGSNANQLSTYTYSPANPGDDIPQQAVPMLLNLWCYKGFPSSGNDVEVVLQDFQFVPEGQPIPTGDASTEPIDAGSSDAEAVEGGGGNATPDAAGPADGGASSGDAGGGGSGNGTGGGGVTGTDSGVTSQGGAPPGTSSGCSVTGGVVGGVDRSAIDAAAWAFVAAAALRAARRRRSNATA